MADSWENFNGEKKEWILPGQQKTNIICPECGKYIYMDTTVVLTSNPEQYVYWCSCGWEGHSTRKWTKGW